jgi:hypothetical protein
VAPEEASEADPVGATPFDAEAMQVTETFGPSQEDGVALIGGINDEWLRQMAPEAIERNGDVLIFVGVNADDNVGAFECDAGHGCWVTADMKKSP